MITLLGTIVSVAPGQSTNKETGDFIRFTKIGVLSIENDEAVIRNIKASFQNLSQWEKFTNKMVTISDLRIWSTSKEKNGLFLSNRDTLPVLVS